ncbi:MAG TPA: phosphatase PAP2 family protein [Verrucomicrobiae bacterium]|jgi:membrane-associated phospholipid phosphatase|nr:phosphatase PAP2 family protein [Verrucomicrobiae bacterium]
MHRFFSTLPRNVIGCFKSWNILAHLVAIALTLILVTSGFDWVYFRSTRNPELRAWMFPAVIIGQGVPMILPLLLLLIGIAFENAKTIRAAWGIGQAAFIGWFISSCYKALTGRDPLPHGIGHDTSRVFRFGLLRHGIFWGWPSSHTAVAFAMAVTVLVMFRQQRLLCAVVALYALYIGVGVSMTIHWFSDFIAGALIGTAIGLTAGKSFSTE